MPFIGFCLNQILILITKLLFRKLRLGLLSKFLNKWYNNRPFYFLDTDNLH
jgi:hypothetical protein